MQLLRQVVVCILCLPVLVSAFAQKAASPKEPRPSRRDIGYIRRATTVVPRIRQDRPLTPSRFTPQEVERLLACRKTAEELPIAVEQLSFMARLFKVEKATPEIGTYLLEMQLPRKLILRTARRLVKKREQGELFLPACRSMPLVAIQHQCKVGVKKAMEHQALVPVDYERHVRKRITNSFLSEHMAPNEFERLLGEHTNRTEMYQTCVIFRAKQRAEETKVVWEEPPTPDQNPDVHAPPEELSEEDRIWQDLVDSQQGKRLRTLEFPKDFRHFR